MLFHDQMPVPDLLHELEGGDVFINICQFDEAKLKPDTLGYLFHRVITGFALGMTSDAQVGIPQKCDCI